MPTAQITEVAAPACHTHSPPDSSRLPRLFIRSSKTIMSESKSLDTALQSALTVTFGDRYQLLERLGTGAHGVVFRARDTMLDRDVAIKQVRLDNFRTADQAKDAKLRTQREAKMAAKLRHTGIVAVHDIVHTETSTLIIMEYVHGKTLEDKLREQRRLDLEQTIEIVAQTADALDHAHAQGVVHRDIKPANLMITDDGSVKIADFGLAKSQSGSETTSNITATGSVLGTPYYMSPEQARGEDDLDGRSDLFSLGCVTYECLTGRKPFRGKSVIDVLLTIVNGEPAELDCDELELHADRVGSGQGTREDARRTLPNRSGAGRSHSRRSHARIFQRNTGSDESRAGRKLLVR